MRHAERHVGALGRHRQRAEQPHEMRIGDVIKYHEARVDRHRATGLVHRHGVRVPAGVVGGFENRELVIAVEKPGRAETGDTGADDCEAWHGKNDLEGSPEAENAGRVFDSDFCPEDNQEIEARSMC